MELISSGTCDMFGGGGCSIGKLGTLESSSAIASTVAFLSTLQYNFQPVESFISFISLQSSYAWYLKLSQFETIFLGLIMIQICFFRYLEVLPININNWFLGDPSGRRRRRKRSLFGKIGTEHFDCEGDLLTRSLFKVLKVLDDGNCLPLALCELESMSTSSNKKIGAINRKLPEQTFALLNILKRFARSRNKSALSQDKATIGHLNDHDDFAGNDDHAISSASVYNCAVLDGLKVYEDAVLLGSSVASAHYHNSTICQDKYSACPLTKQDIQHYVTVLIDANML